MLVSERIGQFFVDAGSGRDRLEYTEYGAGDHWVVLLHGQLMPRRMHQPLARALAAEGLHVVTLDLLGHGRSDRPADPLVYSMTAFAEQVVALLDHLGADQAIVGGTSLGANVALEVADLAPERVRGLLVEMPVLDNALEAGILAFAPLMFAARFLPFTVDGLRADHPPDPAGGRAVLGRASPSTPSTSGPSRSRRWCTGCSSAGSPRRPGSAGRSPRRRWWSATPPTRSTRPPTPRCWPTSCPTRGSSAPAASSSGGSGPSGSTTRRPSSRWTCWQTPRRDAPYRRRSDGRARRRQNGRVPLYRDEAIVLRTHKLGEADRIITLLTREHGRVRAVAKGVRRTTSKFGSRLEPFTHVDVQLAEGRNLDIDHPGRDPRRRSPRRSAPTTSATPRAR